MKISCPNSRTSSFSLFLCFPIQWTIFSICCIMQKKLTIDSGFVSFRSSLLCSSLLAGTFDDDPLDSCCCCCCRWWNGEICKYWKWLYRNEATKIYKNRFFPFASCDVNVNFFLLKSRWVRCNNKRVREKKKKFHFNIPFLFSLSLFFKVLSWCGAWNVVSWILQGNEIKEDF